MATFHLEIATPDGLIFDGEAEAIALRTENGDIEIMRGHTDYFAVLGIGKARLTANGTVRNASSAGGFVSVKDGEVKVVATTLEFADEIDINRARAAKERAESALEKASDEKTVRVMKAKLARALNRINVADLD